MRIKINEIIKNFWNKNLEEIFQREDEISEFSWNIRKAVTLIWPRRSWKTSICFKKIGDLLEGWIDKKNILYVNFEDETLLDFEVEHFDILVKQYFELSWLNTQDKNVYFFFDEIQNIKNWEKFITRILSNFKCNVWITWSSAKMLSKDINTWLRWKNISFEVLPLNFDEFLNFKNLLLENNFQYSIDENNNYKKNLKEFIVRWWFPEIILEKSEKNKNLILKNYYDLIFYKDIIDRQLVRDIRNIKKFRKILTYNFTNKISLKKISDELWVWYQTILNWYEYFIDAYYWFSLKKFNFSILDVEKSFSKFYLIDNWFFSVNFFDLNSMNFSSLFENMVFLEFRKKWFVENENIFYYSDQKIWEIDFVTFKWWKVTCYQVSWDIDDKKTFNREIASLKKAREKFWVSDLNLIVWEWKIEIEEVDWIKIIPFFEFIKKI